MNVVYRYRVKNLNGLLNEQARAVNYVWNFCNDTQKHALKWNKKWPSGYDLNNLTSGSCKELGLHSSTINYVCEQYAKSRQQQKKRHLKYRSKKNLGWIPLKSGVNGKYLRETEDGFIFMRKEFKVFKSRNIPVHAKIKDGSSFSQDARGNWFLNVCIEIPDAPQRQLENGVGIDLGLKDFTTLSTGEKVKNPRHFRKQAEKLAKSQRARKKRQTRNIHARILNSRVDHHHKLSHRLVQEFDYIAVGNVNAASLAKTKMAKSVRDAAWSSFRDMLRYKAIRHGVWFEEVNEKMTTQTCSSCGSMDSETRPKGIAGLGIRTWCCTACGTIHDRDVNAARNILFRSGHRALAEGIAASNARGCQ